MKTALIWGASGGIGRAPVDHLSAQGWRVLAVDAHIMFLGAISERLCLPGLKAQQTAASPPCHE